MNSIKCPQCGLVNFASAAACKRCQLAFEPAAAGFDQPAGGPGEFAPAGQGDWSPAPYFPQGFEDFGSEAAAKNAKLGKASAVMALLAIVSMGLTHFVSRVLWPVAPLLLLAGFVTGIVAWVKLRRSGDADGGLRGARLGTILSGLLLVLVTLAVGGVFAFNYVRSAVVAKTFEVRDQPRWREYVSPEGDFSVQMPGEVELQEGEKGASGASGVPISASAAGAPDGSGCVVVVADYTSQLGELARRGMTAETLLGAATLSAIRERDVTVLNRRSITHQGHPGTEFEYLDPPKGSEAERLRGVARVVWASPRMYVVLLSAPEGSPLYAERQTFLDSYRLLGSQ